MFIARVVLLLMTLASICLTGATGIVCAIVSHGERGLG